MIMFYGMYHINPSGAETKIFWDNWVTTMAVNALAPCTPKSSETLLLMMLNEQVLVFQKEGFQLAVSSQYCKMTENGIIFSFYF